MKEIKFKALSKNGKNWVYGDLVVNKECGACRIIESFTLIDFEDENVIISGEGIHLVDPETVCQFTGITDKNGTEISNGDITDAFEFVIFDNGSYRTTHKGDQTGGTILTKKRAKYIEIIGSIHTNPELLNS